MDMSCMHLEMEAVITLFGKPGYMPITIPKHEPIKRVYVKMVKDVIESEGFNHERL